jgi:RNA polymerase sigma-70 factor (ECF subfamily)
MDSNVGWQSVEAAAAHQPPDGDGARASDPTLIEQLLRQHRPALIGHVKRILGRAEDAEDVVQELCIRLMRARDYWRGERQVRAFLFKIATNLARDELRRRRACAYAAHVPYETMELISEAEQPEEIVERQLALRAISRALRVLPPRYRKVFALHVEAQMSYRAISRHLGISTKTVERDICGAREFCRHRLGSQERSGNWPVHARRDGPAPLAPTGS